MNGPADRLDGIKTDAAIRAENPGCEFPRCFCRVDCQAKHIDQNAADQIIHGVDDIGRL